MRMSLIPPPHNEGYASYLAAMQLEPRPPLHGTNRPSFRRLSFSNPWTISTRKKTRTTTRRRDLEDLTKRKMKTI